MQLDYSKLLNFKAYKKLLLKGEKKRRETSHLSSVIQGHYLYLLFFRIFVLGFFFFLKYKGINKGMDAYTRKLA